MAASIEQNYIRYKGAVAIYDILKTKLDKNEIKVGQAFSFPIEYWFSMGDTNITNIAKALLASRSFGFEQQGEPGGSGALQWIINNSPADPFGADYNQLTREMASYRDFVALYDYCLKIFSDKVIRPKVGQRYAFQDIYFYAFDQGLPCADVISVLSTRFNNTTDSFLECTNQGSYYENVP